MNICKKIVIAGGTGFIGNYLCTYFAKKNIEVVVLSRSNHSNTSTVRYVYWDGVHLDEWSKELDGAGMLINLSGKSVNCRYTEKNKQEIFDSRTNSTTVLGMAVNRCSIPPLLWINAASATIYRHAEDRPQDEYTGEFHSDFSVQVCQRWEASFNTITTPHTRKVLLRSAIVLGKKDGVLKRFETLVRFGLGGKQGNGRQYFSWIHEFDLARMIEYIYEHPSIEGVYNASAPEPVPNIIFMEAIRKQMNCPVGIPQPAWLLKIGARIIGTEAELLLKSRWVLPAKLLEAGFVFRFPTIESALQDLMKD